METDPPVRRTEVRTPRFHQRLDPPRAAGEAPQRQTSALERRAGGSGQKERKNNESPESRLPIDVIKAHTSVLQLPLVPSATTVASSVAAAAALAAAAAASLCRYRPPAGPCPDSEQSSSAFTATGEDTIQQSKSAKTVRPCGFSGGENVSLKTYFTSSSELTLDTRSPRIQNTAGSETTETRIHEKSPSARTTTWENSQASDTITCDCTCSNASSPQSHGSQKSKSTKSFISKSSKSAGRLSHHRSSPTSCSVSTNKESVRNSSRPRSSRPTIQYPPRPYTCEPRRPVERSSPQFLHYICEPKSRTESWRSGQSSIPPLSPQLTRRLHKKGAQDEGFHSLHQKAMSPQHGRSEPRGADICGRRNAAARGTLRGRPTICSVRSKSTASPHRRAHVGEERECETWRRGRAAMQARMLGPSLRPTQTPSQHTGLQAQQLRRPLTGGVKRAKSRACHRDASACGRSLSRQSRARRRRSRGPSVATIATLGAAAAGLPGPSGTVGVMGVVGSSGVAPGCFCSGVAGRRVICGGAKLCAGPPRRRRATTHRSFSQRHHRMSRSRASLSHYSNVSSESLISESSNAASGQTPTTQVDHGRCPCCHQGTLFGRSHPIWPTSFRGPRLRTSIARSRSCGLWITEHGSGGGGGGGGALVPHFATNSAPPISTAISSVDFVVGGGRLGYTGPGGPNTHHSTSLGRKPSHSNSSRKSDADSKSQTSEQQMALLPAQDSKEEFVQKFAQPKRPEKKKKRVVIAEQPTVPSQVDGSDDEPRADLRGRMGPFKQPKEPKEPEVENLSEVKAVEDVESWLQRLCGYEAHSAAAPRPACEQAMCVAYAQLLNSGTAWRAGGGIVGGGSGGGVSCGSSVGSVGGVGGVVSSGGPGTDTGSEHGGGASVKLYPCESQSDMTRPPSECSGDTTTSFSRRSVVTSRLVTRWRPRYTHGSSGSGVTEAPDLPSQVLKDPEEDEGDSSEGKEGAESAERTLMEDEDRRADQSEFETETLSLTESVRGAEAMLSAPSDAQMLHKQQQQQLQQQQLQQLQQQQQQSDAERESSVDAGDRSLPVEHSALLVDLATPVLLSTFSRLSLSESPEEKSAKDIKGETLIPKDIPRKLRPLLCGPKEGAREKTTMEQEITASACGDGDGNCLHLPDHFQEVDGRSSFPAGDRFMRVEGHGEFHPCARHHSRRHRGECGSASKTRPRRHLPLSYAANQNNNADFSNSERRKLSAKLRKKLMEVDKRQQNSKYTLTYAVPDLSHCRAKVDSGLRSLDLMGRRSNVRTKSRAKTDTTRPKSRRRHSCLSAEVGAQDSRSLRANSQGRSAVTPNAGATLGATATSRGKSPCSASRETGLFPRRQLTQILEAVDEERSDPSEPPSDATDASRLLRTDTNEATAGVETEVEGTSVAGALSRGGSVSAAEGVTGDGAEGSGGGDGSLDNAAPLGPLSISIHIPIAAIAVEDSSEGSLSELVDLQTRTEMAEEERCGGFCDAQSVSQDEKIDESCLITSGRDCAGETKLSTCLASEKSSEEGRHTPQNDHSDRLSRESEARENLLPQDPNAKEYLTPEATSSSSSSSSESNNTSDFDTTSENMEAQANPNFDDTEVRSVDTSPNKEYLNPESDNEQSIPLNAYSESESLSDFSACGESNTSSSSSSSSSSSAYANESVGLYLHDTFSNESIVSGSDDGCSDGKDDSIVEEGKPVNREAFHVRDNNACGDQQFHNEEKPSLMENGALPSGESQGKSLCKSAFSGLTQGKAVDVIPPRPKTCKSARSRKRKTRLWVRTALKDFCRECPPHDIGAFGEKISQITRFRFDRNTMKNRSASFILRKNVVSSSMLQFLEDKSEPPSCRPKSEESWFCRNHYPPKSEIHKERLLTSEAYLKKKSMEENDVKSGLLIRDPPKLAQVVVPSSNGCRQDVRQREPSKEVARSNLPSLNTCTRSINVFRVQVTDTDKWQVKKDQTLSRAAPVESYASIESGIEMENGSDGISEDANDSGGTNALPVRNVREFHLGTISVPEPPPGFRDFAYDDLQSSCSDDSIYTDTSAFERALQEIEEKLSLVARKRGMLRNSAPPQRSRGPASNMERLVRNVAKVGTATGRGAQWRGGGMMVTFPSCTSNLGLVDESLYGPSYDSTRHGTEDAPPSPAGRPPLLPSRTSALGGHWPPQDVQGAGCPCGRYTGFHGPMRVFGRFLSASRKELLAQMRPLSS